MADNEEFDESAIFLGVLYIVQRGQFQNIEDPSLVGLGYQMLPIATIQNMQSFNHILMRFTGYRTLIVHSSHQSEILHSLIFVLQ